MKCFVAERNSVLAMERYHWNTSTQSDG